MMINSALVFQNLIIVSAMTPAEMKFKNTHLGMLKIITDNDNFFIAGNGIRQNESRSFKNKRQSPQLTPQPKHDGLHARQTSHPHKPHSSLLNLPDFLKLCLDLPNSKL
jgi:hypothetical protein